MSNHAPLHRQRPTERFADRASQYASARPAYPDAAIDATLNRLGPPETLIAVDIGAGTGISARQLADRGVTVHAVEPNPDMRDAASPHPRITWHDSAAEQTRLPDQAADLVLCAQAFHWLDPEPAIREFVRILRPGARAVLLWNERDDDDPTTHAYTNIIRTASNNHPALTRNDTHGPFSASARLRNHRHQTFPHAQTLTPDGLIERAASSSYIPQRGRAHDAMIDALRSLADRATGNTGHLALRYRTELYSAETPSDNSVPNSDSG